MNALIDSDLYRNRKYEAISPSGNTVWAISGARLFAQPRAIEEPPTKRDRLAKVAEEGIREALRESWNSYSEERVKQWAYAQADALIAALNEKEAGK